MFHLKNKTITKIAVFAVIALVILWLLPVGLVSAEEGTGETSTGTTVETTAPETTAPETTAPETTAPETTAPETTAPETTAPETTAPETTVETIVTDVTLEDSIVLLNPTLETDKPDYFPGDIVIISGTGFAPNTNYTIVVEPLGSQYIPDSFSILTDAIGSFTHNYQLTVVASRYNVKAIDSDGNVVATTSFTDCHITVNKSGLLGGLTTSFTLEKRVTGSGGAWTTADSWIMGNGTHTCSNVDLGYEYQLTEIIPSGYTIQWQVIDAGFPANNYAGIFNPIPIWGSYAAAGCNVNITNIPTGSGDIQVHKTLSGGGNGTFTFHISKDNDGTWSYPGGDQSVTFTNGTQTPPGDIVFNNLPMDSNYTITETVHTNYTPDHVSVSDITPGVTSPTVVNFVNTYNLGDIQVHKTLSGGGNGTFTFQIRDDNDTAWRSDQGDLTVTFTNGTPDPLGYLVWNNLPTDTTYTITEILHNNYIPDHESVSGISPGTTLPTHVDFVNTYNLGEIRVHKTLSGGGNGTFTFRISKDNDSTWSYPGGDQNVTFLNGIQTNPLGDLVFNNLPLDSTYTIEETAHTNYTADHESVSGISPGTTSPFIVDFVNTYCLAYLRVEKTNLRGTDLANLTLWKDNGAPGVSGEDVNYGTKLFSNDNTQTWPDLPYGNYYILEDFTGITTNVFTYNVSNPVWAGNINGNLGVTTPVPVINTALVGSLRVQKTNLRGTDSANLTLWKDNGAVGVSGEDVNYGLKVFSNINNIQTWTDLPYGNYYILEDFTGITTNVFTYSITNPVWSGNVNGDIGTPTAVVVSNTPLVGSLRVQKTNLRGLDKANLTLWKDNGAAGVSPDDVSYGTKQFSNSGIQTWTDLPYGNYYILEDFIGITTNVYTYSVTNPFWSGNVNGNIGQTTPVILRNTPMLGSLTVQKTNLRGSDEATLWLWKDNGTVGVSPDDYIWDVITFSNNETHTWGNLPYGNYYILEDFTGTTNVFTYSVTNPVWSGNVNGDIGTPTPVCVVNIPLVGSLRVQKSDLHGTDLANLTLWKDNGAAGVSPDDVSYGTKQFSNSGIQTWTDLPYGNYYILEDFAGITTNVFTYRDINPVWSGVINGDIGQPNPVPVYNIALVGSLRVQKTNLQGTDSANLTLWKDNGALGVSPEDISYGLKVFSNASGTQTWSILPYGNYYILEDFTGITTNIFTYSITNPVWSGNINGNIGQTAPVVVTNTAQTGSIQVTKTNLMGNDMADLYLWKTNHTVSTADDTQMLPTVTFTNGGTYTWTGLAYDTYYVIEDFFGITTNVYTYSVTNPVSNNIVVDSATPVARTVVNIPQDGSIEITKTGLLGTDTAIFTLTGGPVGFVLPGPITFSSSSPAQGWDELPYGTYTVTETWGLGNVYTYTSNIGPGNAVTFGINGANEDHELSIINTPVRGTIDLIKYLDYGTPPSGSVFVINWSGTDGTSDSLNLDESNGWAINGFELYSGVTYTFTEAPNSEFGFIKILISGTTEVLDPGYTFTAIPGSNDSIAWYNRTGSITITKRDLSDPQIVLEGAVFRLFMADGTTLATNAWGNPLGDQTSDVNGHAYFTGLKFGTYVIAEIQAPPGYDVTDPTTVIVGGEGGADIAVDILDPRIPSPKRGSIEIQKVPAVAGVGFTLFESDGTTVAAAEKFTDGSGKVTFSGLKYGTYIVRETTGIPGYSLAADQSVTINSGNVATLISLTFTNTPTTTITVAGLTTPGFIQVLAFTGMDPIIPISGGSAVIGGLAMLLATLRRKRNKK